MKRILLAAALIASPAMAQDFSEGSNARSWNLYAEVPATFAAKVVDITCEITGDCVDNCGDGARQLGLLRDVDGVLVYPNKNNQTSFNGAGADLLAYCGKQVEVDGLLIEDPDINAKNIFQLQTIREAGATEWSKANQWTKIWAANTQKRQVKALGSAAIHASRQRSPTADIWVLA